MSPNWARTHRRIVAQVVGCTPFCSAILKAVVLDDNQDEYLFYKTSISVVRSDGHMEALAQGYTLFPPRSDRWLASKSNNVKTGHNLSAVSAQQTVSENSSQPGWTFGFVEEMWIFDSQRATSRRSTSMGCSSNHRHYCLRVSHRDHPVS